MGAIGRVFMRGLLAILPLGATIAVLLWLGGIAEATLGGLIKLVLPKAADGSAMYYIPGMGIVVGFVLIFILGIVVNAWIVRGMLSLGERFVQRLPLAKTIFSAVQDMLGFFRGDKANQMSQVVTLELQGMQLVGFVTRSSCDDLPNALCSSDKVAVYLPMSYQLGGFTVFVNRSAVTTLDMSMEDAMRMVLTAGVKKVEGEVTSH
jgi:uncharacterized membrane protein